MPTTHEPTHLCPICNVVEMVFVERIQSKQYFRMRRFKCPVCNHAEMYTCSGPDDLKRQEVIQERIKSDKELLKIRSKMGKLSS